MSPDSTRRAHSPPATTYEHEPSWRPGRTAGPSLIAPLVFEAASLGAATTVIGFASPTRREVERIGQAQDLGSGLCAQLAPSTEGQAGSTVQTAYSGSSTCSARSSVGICDTILSLRRRRSGERHQPPVGDDRFEGAGVVPVRVSKLAAECRRCLRFRGRTASPSLPARTLAVTFPRSLEGLG
jgi:hypothetical protein